MRQFSGRHFGPSRGIGDVSRHHRATGHLNQPSLRHKMCHLRAGRIKDGTRGRFRGVKWPLWAVRLTLQHSTIVGCGKRVGHKPTQLVTMTGQPPHRYGAATREHRLAPRGNWRTIDRNDCKLHSSCQSSGGTKPPFSRPSSEACQNEPHGPAVLIRARGPPPAHASIVISFTSHTEY